MIILLCGIRTTVGSVDVSFNRYFLLFCFSGISRNLGHILILFSYSIDTCWDFICLDLFLRPLVKGMLADLLESYDFHRDRKLNCNESIFIAFGFGIFWRLQSAEMVQPFMPSLWDVWSLAEAFASSCATRVIHQIAMMIFHSQFRHITTAHYKPSMANCCQLPPSRRSCYGKGKWSRTIGWFYWWEKNLNPQPQSETKADRWSCGRRSEETCQHRGRQNMSEWWGRSWG